MSNFFDDMRERATSLMENANEGLERRQQEAHLRREIKAVRQQITEQLLEIGHATLDLHRQDALPVAKLVEQCRQVLALEEAVAGLEAQLSSLATATASVSCNACGSPLEANADFCNRCGQPVVPPTSSEAEQPVKAATGTRRLALCEQCGAPLEAGASFCDTCGRAIPDEAPAAERGTRLLATCTNCGTPLPAGAESCGECEHPLPITSEDAGPKTDTPDPLGAEPGEAPGARMTVVAEENVTGRGTRLLDYCEACGTPLIAGAEACSECGQATAPTESRDTGTMAEEEAGEIGQAGETGAQTAAKAAGPEVAGRVTRLLANCRHCGTALIEDALFCSDCGHPVAGGDDPAGAAITNEEEEQPGESGGTRLLANCQGCGALLPDDGDTCRECGRPVTGAGPARDARTPVADAAPELARTEWLPGNDREAEAAEEARPAAAARRCAHCGQTVRTTSPFCPACGGPLADSAASAGRSGVRMHCGMVLEPHVDHCPQCGLAVPPVGTSSGSGVGERARAAVICPDCHTSFSAGTLFCPACGYFMKG